MVVFADKVHDHESESTRHWEGFNSANWNSMRFKPPPDLTGDLPWRVEFRTMEIQPTIERNLRLCACVEWLTKAVLDPDLDLNFYLPISLVDENMKRAYEKGAAVNGKFWFRKHPMGSKSAKDEYVELTIEEIIQGKPGEFIGLKSIMCQYFSKQCARITAGGEELKKTPFTDRKDLEQAFQVYKAAFDDILAVSKGEVPTFAAWMREFITEHPAYQHDNVISDQINHDINEVTVQITKGEVSIDQPFWASKEREQLRQEARQRRAKEQELKDLKEKAMRELKQKKEEERLLKEAEEWLLSMEGLFEGNLSLFCHDSQLLKEEDLVLQEILKQPPTPEKSRGFSITGEPQHHQLSPPKCK